MLPTDALQTCESCVESCAVYSHCDATRHKRRGQLPSSPIMLRHTLLMDLLLAIVSEIPSDSFLLPTARTTCYFPFNVATQFGTSGSAPAAQGMAGSTSVGESTLAIPKVDEGYDLNGILTIKNTESKSLWVVCHGLCSSSVGSVPRFVSNMLQANTFRFDFSGCGRSGGDWKYAGYNRELDDLRIVVLRLRELGWNVHGVLGHSKGAAAVLRYGERFDDVPLLVNVAGRFHTSATPRSRFSEEQWEQLEETGSFMWNVKGEDLPVTKEDFEERAGLDMKKTAESIKNAKVLTIHGEEDETIPVADAQEFDRHVAQHELVIVEGAGHSFLRDPERAAVIEALGRYLEDVGSTEAR